MTRSKRLLLQLRAAGVEMPDDVFIQRSYAGHWQRKEGAWSWFVVSAISGPLDIGSQDTVTELLHRGFVINRDQFRQVQIDAAPGSNHE